MKSLMKVLAACIVALACAPLALAQASIKIDALPLDPTGDTGVQFTNPVSTPAVRLSPFELMKMRPYLSDDRLYLVYVNFAKTSPTEPPSDINYYLYSQPKSAADKSIFTEFVVVGTPKNDFTDRWSLVKFHLFENGTHDGSLELPVHSFSNANLISIEPDLQAGMVKLSEPRHRVDFTAKNSVKGFELNVIGADLTPVNEDNWKWNSRDHSYAVEFDESSRPPLTLTTAPLRGRAQVQPDLWKSLIASAASLKDDNFPDVLNLTVRYNASLGGNLRALTMPINVRFQPPWWSLLGCAILGAILGSVVTLFFPDTWKGTNAFRTVVSAVFLAIVAEILGMVLFLSSESKLALFGFNLNPTEILPALALGILVGLVGLKTLDSFKIPLPTRGTK